MSWWNAKYKNAHGEYEITFGSKYYEKTKSVEKFCQAIIDKKIDENNAAEILDRIIKAGNVTDTNVGNKWISVKDGLPEVGVRVLVCSLYDLQNIGWHLGDGRWQIKAAYPDTPTHWMPLPEPPKEDEG